MAPCVLVVDDDPVFRSLLREYFRGRGARVVEAGSAASALERLEDGPVDLVVSDVRMPGRPGTWLAREVRRRREGVPVLLVTGEAELEDPGVADAVLRKPLRLAEFAARVDALLARRGSGRQCRGRYFTR